MTTEQEPTNELKTWVVDTSIRIVVKADTNWQAGNDAENFIYEAMSAVREQFQDRLVEWTKQDQWVSRKYKNISARGNGAYTIGRRIGLDDLVDGWNCNGKFIRDENGAPTTELPTITARWLATIFARSGGITEVQHDVLKAVYAKIGKCIEAEMEDGVDVEKSAATIGIDQNGNSRVVF